MFPWIFEFNSSWNREIVNLSTPFTAPVWKLKKEGVCINFTKIASNGVVTQGFDCHLPHFEPRQTRDRATVPNCTKYGQFLLVCATMGWNWFWSSLPIFMHLCFYYNEIFIVWKLKKDCKCRCIKIEYFVTELISPHCVRDPLWKLNECIKKVIQIMT